MPRSSLAVVVLAATLVAACGGATVGSPEDARRAYVGLDRSVDKAITLGFAGYNAAQAATIPTQTTSGDAGGTLVIAGTVDQGASKNRTMHLTEKLTRYTDDSALTYDSPQGQPGTLVLMLKDVPTGTLAGTLQGEFDLSGQLSGPVLLDLTVTAQLQPSATDATQVQRKPGTTHVTGTATSRGGAYTVDVTR